MKKMKLVVKTLFFLIVNASVALGQVTVTAASGGVNLVRSTAVNGSLPAYTQLGDIEILETNLNDVKQSQTGATLILTAPSNWRFNPVSGSVSPTLGDDITSISMVVDSSTITITITTANGGGGFDSYDEITISGIEVQPIDGNITPADGGIMRTSANPGTVDIEGLTAADAINFGSVSTDPLTPMPVELVSFTAIPEGSIIHLRWSTATEIQNTGFEVERSIEEDIWEMIGFVEGHWTSYSPKEYEFIDDLSGLHEIPGLASLDYRLKQIDVDGTFDYYYLDSSDNLNTFVSFDDNVLPVKIELYQNYPNPFNPTTNINYSLSESGNVSLKVYDILGKEVAALVNENKHAGEHSVLFDGSNLSSGVYIYMLQTNSQAVTQKMLLMK